MVNVFRLPGAATCEVSEDSPSRMPQFDERSLKPSTGSFQRRSDRFGYIDSLRGIAALLVIYLHLADWFLRNEPNLGAFDHWSFVALTDVIDIGKVGVIVFFAISGYVIPFSLMRRTDNAVPLFVISRFFRLYPAYWLSLPAGLVILVVVAHQHIDAPLVVANATMLQQFFGIENILGIYWTLQIELIFYALCIGLFVIGLLQKTKFIFSASVIFLAFALVLSAVRFYSGMKLPVVVPLSLAVMFWGMIRRQADDGERTAVKMDVSLLVVFAVVIPLVSFLAYNRDYGYNETWYRYTISYGVAIALFALCTSRVRINFAGMRYLGRISYSIYLFGPVAEQIILLSLLPRLGLGQGAHLYIGITMVLAVAMAAVIYRFVEAPSIAFGRRISEKFCGRGGMHELQPNS
jgi:peptidoglycan/LPS O-acetylase OafA/YrhL